MNELLTAKDFELKTGFAFAYLSVLKAIRDDSLVDLGTFCEKTLYNQFSEGIQDLNRETTKIEILNEDLFPGNMSMKLVDFNQTFGCFTDRELNRTRQVEPFSSFMAPKRKHENFEMYMPSLKAYGDYLPLNMELLIRVETNLKLNLIDHAGKSLIPESEKEDDEVHFIKLECTLTKYQIDLRTIFKMLKELITRSKDLQFSDWTVTDFDHYLNGNPHIPKE